MNTALEKLYEKIVTKLDEKLDEGVKKAHICSETGIKTQNFARVERCLRKKQNLNTETLNRLCEYLGVK